MQNPFAGINRDLVRQAPQTPMSDTVDNSVDNPRITQNNSMSYTQKRNTFVITS